MGPNVGKEVVDQLTQPIPVPGHPGRHELEGEGTVGIDDLGGVDGLVYHPVELDVLFCKRSAFIEMGEQQQIVDEQAHPLRLARDP
jgi:hypothetical protein